MIRVQIWPQQTKQSKGPADEILQKLCMLNINLYSVLASGQGEQKNFFCSLCRPFCKTARINNVLLSPIWPAHAFSGEAVPACRSVGECSPPAPEGWDGG